MAPVHGLDTLGRLRKEKTMLTPAQAAENWLKVKKHYEETRETNPEVTAKAIVDDIGITEAVETFAVIARIKRYDGRIYGENRRFMNNVPVDPDCTIWDGSNPVIKTGLDDIHTAHINQIIGGLRKIYDNQPDKIIYPTKGEES